MIKTGKHKNKSWKRMVNKATFVGEGFTRKPVKLEVSCRPSKPHAARHVAERSALHSANGIGKL